MTDPTALDVKIPSPEFMDNYDTGQSNFVPPPQVKEIQPNGKPKYFQFLAQAPSVDKIVTRDQDNKPLTTAKGYFKVIVSDIKLPESGYVVQQTHIGTEQYDKYDRKTNQKTGEKRNASPAIDYLHAHGIDLKPSTVEEYEEYFRATADRQFQVTGEWSAYNSDTKQDVASKWEQFPDASTDAEAFARMYPGVDPAGKKLPYVEKDGKRFWARLSIKRFVSTVESK